MSASTSQIHKENRFYIGTEDAWLCLWPDFFRPPDAFEYVKCYSHLINSRRSKNQYSNMTPRLSGQTSIFGVVFFVFKSPLGIERQKKLENFDPKASEPCLNIDL